jgi:hypothetical protein
MSWENILKEEPEWKKRLKRIKEANEGQSGRPKGKGHGRRRGVRGGTKNMKEFRTETSSKTYACDMCGKITHARNIQESSLNTGSKYCSQCARARGN